jgi:F-type H+-transporting ATPase subunit delta
MIDSNVARRYAKAMVEIGIESGSLDSLVRELGDLAAAYKSSPEFQDALENPLVAIQAKHAVVAEVAGRVAAGPMTKNLVRMLTDRRRMSALPRIAELVNEMSDARKGVVHAEVVSAVELSEGFYARLQRELEQMTGQKIVLDRRIDPSVVGGVAARIGDMVIDGSLRASLHEMRSTLLAAEVTKTNGAGAPMASA